MPLIIALAAVGVVLYLSYLFSRYLAIGAAKISKSKFIKVVDRVVLGQDRLLLIATIGGRSYLIGASAHSIQLLTELENNEMFDDNTPEKTSDFGAFKNVLKGRLR